MQVLFCRFFHPETPEFLPFSAVLTTVQKLRPERLPPGGQLGVWSIFKETFLKRYVPFAFLKKHFVSLFVKLMPPRRNSGAKLVILTV